MCAGRVCKECNYKEGVFFYTTLAKNYHGVCLQLLQNYYDRYLKYGRSSLFWGGEEGGGIKPIFILMYKVRALNYGMNCLHFFWQVGEEGFIGERVSTWE